MKWISVKDKLPQETGKYYLIMSDSSCDDCILTKDHGHRLDFKRYRFDIALWYEKDLDLAKECEEKWPDKEWDDLKHDRFTECKLFDDEITHWMPFPNEPK